MSQRIEENIAKLREIYINESPDALQQINAWEVETKRLLAQKDYAEHELTQRIIKFATRRVDQIEHLLANDQKLTDVERAKLFASKECFQWYLNLFDPAVLEKRLDELDRTVKTELSEGEEDTK